MEWEVLDDTNPLGMGMITVEPENTSVSVVTYEAVVLAEQAVSLAEHARVGV